MKIGLCVGLSTKKVIYINSYHEKENEDVAEEDEEEGCKKEVDPEGAYPVPCSFLIVALFCFDILMIILKIYYFWWAEMQQFQRITL